MAITQAMCTSFKVELMQALHNFTNGSGNAFKIALYTSAATLGEGTTAYTTSGEVVGTGYTAGGVALTNVTPTYSSTTAYTDFSNDPQWTTATITARGALIYNTTSSNRAVVVLDFGSDKTSTAGTFTVVFPTANATDALIRIA